MVLVLSEMGILNCTVVEGLVEGRTFDVCEEAAHIGIAPVDIKNVSSLWIYF